MKRLDSSSSSSTGSGTLTREEYVLAVPLDRRLPKVLTLTLTLTLLAFTAIIRFYCLPFDLSCNPNQYPNSNPIPITNPDPHPKPMP